MNSASHYELSAKQYRLGLAAIVVVGTCARLFHRTLAANSDEQQYILFARQLTGTVPLPIRGFGYGTRPLWGWTLNLWGQMTGGINLTSATCLTFLFAATAIVLVAMIAKRIFGPVGGLFAAAVQACYAFNVSYDVMITPDSLAVPVLLLAVWLFLQFLQRESWIWLAATGIVLAQFVFIKNYYAIFLLAFGYILLSTPPTAEVPLREGLWAKRFRSCLVLAAAFLCGVAPGLLIAKISRARVPTDNPPIASLAEYFEARDAVRGNDSSSPLALVEKRFKYFSYFLLENDAAGGLLLLTGGLYLAWLARSRLDCRLIIIAAAGMFVFLSAFPLRLYPPVFLEQMPRYLLPITALLSIGAGGLLAAGINALRSEKSLSICAWAALIAIGIVNLWQPNYRNPNVPISIAQRKCIAAAKEAGAVRLVLPWYYLWVAPDAVAPDGLEIVYPPKPSSFPPGTLNTLRRHSVDHCQTRAACDLRA